MFSILKFLHGFNIFSGEKLAKIIFFAILFLLFTVGYDKMTNKETTKNIVGTGGTQIINTCPPIKPHFGCTIWSWMVKLGPNG